ncbi:zinc carboxypeptidase [Hydra vulgaris]|uniref:zinc carboxypeptidase n=1 Tax=Hydra vulgaris TaxID=6087 RepID=UPI0001925ED6|nr:zinc carboxypeptidase [Hydra vulgaris]
MKLATACLLLLGVVCAERVHYFGDKVFQITPKTEEESDWLHSWIESTTIKLDVWRNPKGAGRATHIHVKAVDVESVTEVLKQKAINFTITIDDLEKVINREHFHNQLFSYNTGVYSFDRFNRYSEIDAQLTQFANTNYNHAKVNKFVMGTTFERRQINGIKITAKSGPSTKPAIWVDGGIHPREWISPATVMYLAKLLLQPIQNVDKVLAKYDIYIVPVVNVDGYEFTHTGDRMWRKTRSNCRISRCCGVDPNRNWANNFGGAGTSTDQCSEIYRGTQPFSEPCVKALSDYLRSLKNSPGGLKSYWNVHAFSELLLTPIGYSTTLPRDYAEIKRVGDIFAAAVQKTYGRRFEVGPPSRILYPVGGGSMDWTYENLGVVYSYGPELRPSRNAGNGFIVSPTEIRPSGEEFTAGFLAAALAMK